MSIIEGIQTGIDSRLATLLEPEYEKLTHVYRIEKNRFDGASLRYGSIPVGATPLAGETKAVTRGQGFELLLCESYISASITDDEIREKVITLSGKMEEIETDFMVEKAGAPVYVTNVQPFTIENAVLIEDHKVIVVQASFIVQYRIRWF